MSSGSKEHFTYVPPTYHHEAASNHEAAEVVAKISYLMQLHAKGASVKDATSRSRRDTVRTKRLMSNRI